MNIAHLSASTIKNDKKSDGRRFRNIIANSGLPMENGETRDLPHLYVMSRDRKLIKVSDLATDPDKQTEKYSVNFVANHGHIDPATGGLTIGVEDIIGDAKVWMKDGELYARVYFANNDEKANHAYAVSDNASYSIGTEWSEDGYHETGNDIDGFIGILREISMVDTGNDPRAHTLDHKSTTSKAHGSEAGDDGDNIKSKERNHLMRDIKKDELTPDEAKALKETLAEVVDKFTTDVPESETEPTAREAKDEEGEAAGTDEPAKETEETKDVLHSPVVAIKTNDTAKQPVATSKKDWLHSKAGHIAFADTLRKAGGFNSQFHAAWRDVLTKHMKMDGITGLPTPAPVEQYFEAAFEKSDGIISHFRMINAKSYRSHILAPTSDEGGRAKAHAKGETKDNQDMTDHYRDFLAKMVYKKLDLDATELWENPELIDIRAQELVDAIVVEIERAAIIGDGRTGKKSLFESPRGFYSVLADAKDNSGQGKYTATLLQPSQEAAAGWNLYDASINAKSAIKTDGDLIAIAKSSVAAATMLEKTPNGNYLVAPGTRIEDLLQVTRVYTPSWMEGNEDADVIFLVNNAYAMIGDSQIRTRADFDTSNNTDILLDETPRGGGLDKYLSAVAVKLAKAEE